MNTLAWTAWLERSAVSLCMNGLLLAPSYRVTPATRGPAEFPAESECPASSLPPVIELHLRWPEGHSRCLPRQPNVHGGTAALELCELGCAER
jgi:hypothetical protein